MPTALGDRPMSYDAESKNRCGPFHGDTSEITWGSTFQIIIYIYQNDRPDRNKGGTAFAVNKGIPHTYVDLSPLLSLEATGVSIPIGHTEMLLASVYKSPLIAWRDADITELLNLRTKSILAGDLNAKHPVWNSNVSNPSGLKLLDLFVNCNFDISAPQHTTHFVPNGRGDVLNIVAHNDVRLSEVSSGHHGFRSPTYHVLHIGSY
jgi:hypothetical protein